MMTARAPVKDQRLGSGPPRQTFGSGLSNGPVTWLIVVVGLLVLPAMAFAQEKDSDGPGPLERARDGLRAMMQRISVPNSRLTDGPHVRAAFRDAVEAPSQSTVRVKSDGQNAALGGIVGPDGWILTKATRLTGDLEVVFKDGKGLPAELVGIDKQFDLAMLKVEADGLPVLKLAREHDPQLGQWIAAPGIGRDPVAVGVVSVKDRSIPRQAGILGVILGDAEQGARVDQIIPDSGAAAAGILVNDIIVAINGVETADRPDLIREVRKYSPGDTIRVGIIRDGGPIEIEATLTERVQGMGPDRGGAQNRMGSRLSRRRNGFPAVLTHDAVIKPTDCGGPLIDLDGSTIGFNIARAGRTESYAVSTATVMTRLYDLMSGNLAPEPDEEMVEGESRAKEESAGKADESGDERRESAPPEDEAVPQGAPPAPD